MPRQSPYQIHIPEANVLSYLYPPGQTLSDKPIWIDAAEPQKNLSPHQALSWCKRLGYGLRATYDMQDGEVVLMLSDNHIFVPVLYLGTAGAGLVFSACNPAYTSQEVAKQMKDTECKTFFVKPSMLQTAIDACKIASFPRENILLFADSPCCTISNIRDWREVFSDSESSRAWSWPALSGDLSAKTVAVLNYSSGTTGLPKGVMVSHKNIIANVEQSLYMTRLKGGGREPAGDERWLGFLPLSHAFGQLWTISAALRTLTPCYMMPKFELKPFLSAIQRYKVTTIQTAPPLLVILAKRPECVSYDLSSLRSILCGAAPLSKALQNEVSNKYKLRVFQTYGMTELTCSAFHVPGNLDDRSGSVGSIDPNCEAKLVDGEGNEVGPGQRGELFVRGPNVCLGYWKNEAVTAAAFDQEGFLRTGDIAVYDERGFYWIVDRVKELIKVKGYQVAPAELEAVLLEHPCVADAAVAGLLLEQEERPLAYVVPKDSSQGKVTNAELADWVSSRVSRHKRLTGGVIFVHEIPKSASGKIQRVVLRQWAAKEARARRGAKL